MKPCKPILALCGLALSALLSALLSADAALAREWLSPSPPRAATQDGPAPAPWSGKLWGGPPAGAPAAPSATDCRRPPVPFVLDPLVEDAQADARKRPGGVLDSARMALSAGKAARSEAAEIGAGAAAPATLATPALRSPRPADEPVSAGLIDDNADFGEYLAYRQRRLPDIGQRIGQPIARNLTVADRVRLDVRDSRGRPVPDAAVAVYAAGRAQPLWARTDAAGRAWLMPQPDMAGAVFEVQVSKAGESTRVLWQRGQKDALQAQLAVGAPQRARLDVAFLIDATGSMADEIDKLKRSMRSMADQIAQLPSRPDLCWALVAYRDRGDAFLVRGADFSNDLSAFQTQLAALQAGGGGDYPEALSEALHTAVHRLSWRGEGTVRLLLLVADAPPHLHRGAPHFDDELRGAQGRGIKLHAVGASGLDAVGEYAFRQAAQFTGGRFVFLTYADAANPASGPGRETAHDVRNYSVQSLDSLVVKLVADELAAWPDKP